MIKFDLMSDLHLFHSGVVRDIELTQNSDILVLAGDICELRSMLNLESFFDRLKWTWKHVLYVPGNHEFYHGSIYDETDFVNLVKVFGITPLNNSTVTIDGVKFIGSTLWTDLNNWSLDTIEYCKMFLNDFVLIDGFSPDLMIDKFHQNLTFIENELITDKDCVIITHHAPSHLSVSDRWSDHPMTGAFVTDLSDFIESSPNIKAWVHGHTHSFFDYMIGNTRVVCNPKGYIGELTEFRQEKYHPYEVIV